MCKLVKTNPALFKNLLKNNGVFAGKSEEEIDGYINQLSKMDSDTLKTVMSTTNAMQKYVKPMKELYDRLDKVIELIEYSLSLSLPLSLSLSHIYMLRQLMDVLSTFVAR